MAEEKVLVGVQIELWKKELFDAALRIEGVHIAEYLRNGVNMLISEHKKHLSKTLPTEYDIFQNEKRKRRYYEG